MAPLILLTRPIKQSQEFARQLARPCWIEPMLTVISLPKTIDWDKYTDVILTSPQIFEMVQPLPNHVTYWCVGPRTAKQAQLKNLVNIVSGPGHVQGLLHMILNQQNASEKRYLYLRGQEITQPLIDDMHQANCNVEEIIIYKCQEKNSLSQDLQDHFVNGRISLAPFFSKRTAQTFVRLLCNAQLEDRVRDRMAFALSAKIAQTLQELPWKKIHVNDLLAKTLVEEYDNLTLDR